MSNILKGVAFAKASLTGYTPGLRVLVEATVDPSSHIAALDALEGGAYENTISISSVTYTRLDTGAVLATIATPGSVTFRIEALQRTAAEGKRLIWASIPDYSVGDLYYDGTAFCSDWATIGSTTISSGDYDVPLDLGTPGGLLGRFYNNLDLVGQPVYEAQEDPYIAPYTFGPPAGRAGVSNDFSARWTGAFKAPATGAYQFRINCDDGCRLWINRDLAIDSWIPVPGERTSGTYNFTADDVVSVWIEFFDITSQAYFEWSWLHPGVAEFTRVPAASLYKSDGSEAIPPEARPPIQSSHEVEEIQRY